MTQKITKTQRLPAALKYPPWQRLLIQALYRRCLIGRYQVCVSLILLISWSLGAQPLAAAPEPLALTFLYLKQQVAKPPTLSNRTPTPRDSGIAGAQLAITDSNTTGRFLNQSFSLEIVQVEAAIAAVSAAENWIDAGHFAIVVDVPSDTLSALMASPKIAQSAVVLNATNRDNQWRSDRCQARLLHTAPSRAMVADALAQFLMARRWREWLIIRGDRSEDRHFATSLKRAAARFGGKVVDERVWTFDTDLRRTAQQELPLFTQAKAYDVVLVADEIGDVGEFVPYNTWLPRPVMGTQGLVATTWSPVIEQWGALQLQNRFEQLAGRGMSEADFGAWIAIRAVTEAVTRTHSIAAVTVYDYLLSDAFEVAGFKGRGLSFRRWNGQLRQPMTLVHPRAVVSQSPQQGFLHPRTELDTLGFDKPEVSCQFRD